MEELNIDWEKVFSFLFPDGNILHGSWLSYAIIALVLALFIELGTQLLYLLVRVSTRMVTDTQWPLVHTQLHKLACMSLTDVAAPYCSPACYTCGQAAWPDMMTLLP